MKTTEKPYQLDYTAATARLKNIVARTPLQFSFSLSKKYNCHVYLKREDLQIVRSYKLRGAYNLMSSLPAEQLQQGLVCASAGNHAQGFAYSCKKLKAKGVVFMPVITPKQKITQTQLFGDGYVEIKLTGDTFDDCAVAAKKFTEENAMTFIPPFDDYKIIEGQATVGVEIFEQLNEDDASSNSINEVAGLSSPSISSFSSPFGVPCNGNERSSRGGLGLLCDYLFVPVGGGGLSAGVGSYFKTFSPKTKIIGVEPEGAPSMKAALDAGRPVVLESIDGFVDGAAVKKTGDITFPICKDVLDEMYLIPEGKVCSTILKLYNEDAIVAEPAGALSIAALDYFTEEIKGKNVVCILSGGNNDIDRMQEIKERSLQYEGLKHYFLIRFAQRPGTLKEFVNHVLGPDDDITRFEYMQKHNKESGPALVGVELTSKHDYELLLQNMQQYHVNYTELKKDDNAFGYLV